MMRVKVNTKDIAGGNNSSIDHLRLREPKGLLGLGFPERIMEGAPRQSQHLGLREGSLIPGESVLRHWSSPHGVGVLTENRLLLFGHRGPIHREVEWVADLSRIDSIEVVQLEEVRQYGYGSHATYLGGGKDGGMYYLGALPGSYDVRVDGVTVFRGTPAESEEIQKWIDSAKADFLGTSPDPSTN